MLEWKCFIVLIKDTFFLFIFSDLEPSQYFCIWPKAIVWLYKSPRCNANQIKSLIILAVIRRSVWWLSGAHIHVIVLRQHSSLRRNVAAMASRWQHCVQFDRSEIWTSDLQLQRRTCYCSTNWPVPRCRTYFIITRSYVLHHCLWCPNTIQYNDKSDSENRAVLADARSFSEKFCSSVTVRIVLNWTLIIYQKACIFTFM